VMLPGMAQRTLLGAAHAHSPAAGWGCCLLGCPGESTLGHCGCHPGPVQRSASQLDRHRVGRVWRTDACRALTRVALAAGAHSSQIKRGPKSAALCPSLCTFWLAWRHIGCNTMCVIVPRAHPVMSLLDHMSAPSGTLDVQVVADHSCHRDACCCLAIASGVRDDCLLPAAADPAQPCLQMQTTPQLRALEQSVLVGT
jgi:hypothetical protein